VPFGGGDYRWRYSSAASDWINLAFDSTPPDQMRFRDFNGDGYTDVFATAPLSGAFLQWRVSFSGTTSYQNLAYDDTALDQLRFGDFNADGKTDVFALKDIGGGQLGWDVSYSGTTSYHQINSAPTLLSDMQFGDINGDGHADVFTTVPVTTTPPPLIGSIPQPGVEPTSTW
jgi:FG-GAP-like repeat